MYPHFIICGSPALYSDVVVPGGLRGDSGVDVRFPADITIPPSANGSVTIVDLEIRARCAIGGPLDSVYAPFFLTPRSSISKSPVQFKGLVLDENAARAPSLGAIPGTPLWLANVLGVIDAGYQGPIKAALRNHSSEPWAIRRGEAYLQLIRGDLTPATVGVVTADHPAFAVATVRAEGGFGSSGAAGSGGVTTIYGSVAEAKTKSHERADERIALDRVSEPKGIELSDDDNYREPPEYDSEDEMMALAKAGPVPMNCTRRAVPWNEPMAANVAPAPEDGHDRPNVGDVD